MTDLSAIKLFNAIKRASQPASNPDNMIFGTVESVDPLKVRISDKIVLPEQFLFLGQMCRPHKVTIPHTHMLEGNTGKNQPVCSNCSGTHTHSLNDIETINVHDEEVDTDYKEFVTLEIHPKLKEGDKVLMFAFNNGQMYYVAERIEEDEEDK